ncbi:MAG: CHAT domain-containing protein [Candidatus Aminicenantes bacterium]|nr:CHAT domain-containing protein [Candidatus Aminicenantes bacterium]
MKRFMRLKVLIFCLMFVFGLGYTGLFCQDAGNDLLNAESIDQLTSLIEKALKDNDLQKLEEIKIRNLKLVRENLSLTVQKCNMLLDEGIKNELSGESEKREFDFKIARVMAEIYQQAYNNSYLLDKVDLYSQWGKEEKEKYLEAKKYYGQGEEDKKKYSYETAVSAYGRGLALYREIGYKEGEADILKNLGDAHYQLDEYKNARERYEQGLVIYREIKARLGEANCLKSLGHVDYQLDEYEKARERYEQGLVIFREIKARLGEANSLQSLGNVHYGLDEYEKARERYEQGLVIFREIKDRLGEAESLLRLGEVHRMLSENEKARERYEQGLVIFCDIKARLGEAHCLKSLGHVHMSLSENEKARERYEQGLVIYREIKDRLGEANCLKSLGNVHMSLSEYEKARERYEQGLVIFREIKYRLGEANTLKSLGNVHLRLSEYEKARERYEQALSLQKEIGERYGMGQSYYRLGQTLEAMNKFPAAENEYINSINTTEAIWQEMKREEFKSSFLSSRISPYENLIRLLFKQDKGPLAFHYAERSKARSFLYLLGNKRIDIKKDVPLALVRQEEELRQKIVTFAVQIIDNEKKEPGRRSSPAQLNNEMLQLKQAHSEILEKIKLQCPEYANMISVNPLFLEEIQTLIRQTGNTVFLEYYTTPDAAYLWVLDGKDIFPYKIDINSEVLDKKVREYYTMIATPDAFGVPTLEFQAQELYNLLLKPVENHLAGKTRIAVIPHGVLHYLPFEALMNNGKFLVEQDTSFFYLPSASVYKYCREKNPLKKEQLIALGNPDGSMVWAEKEVEELKGLYNFAPRIYIGKDATETQARTDGPSADILHFSCHGVFDSAHPMYSALKLSPDSKEDGNLDVQEIFQLELKPAYLVTLSACQTHVGKINSGDEIVVMSRAFIYAGTPSIVASLWNVDPDYTEKLMVSFYRALKNMDKIDALHQARKEMMETYGKKHPFYWAPFVLIGDFR